MSRTPSFAQFCSTEVELALRTRLFFAFGPLRIPEVLPHVVWLDDAVRNGVHGLRTGLGRLTVIKAVEEEPQFLKGRPHEGAFAGRLGFGLPRRAAGAWHGSDERWPLVGFFLAAQTERDALGFGPSPATAVIVVVPLGEFRAAGGKTSPGVFSISQKIEYFVTKAGNVLLQFLRPERRQCDMHADFEIE